MLNSSQVDAKKTIRRALLSNRNIKLEAPAGFGKTYLLQDFLRDCPFDKVLVLTETNQALNVLKADLSSVSTKADVVYKTVCSALNYVLVSSSEGFKLEQKADPDWREYDLVIIDEGSQLNSSRWSEIKQYARRLLVSGDSCQAPPVGEQVSPVWMEPWEQVSLTIPMRNDSEIYDYCLQLRDVIGTTKKFPKAFIRTEQEFLELLEDNLIEFLDGKAMALAFSERGQHLHAVRDYNEYIVNALFGFADAFYSGERIVFKKPYIPFVNGIQKDYQLMTNSLARIVEVGEDIRTFDRRYAVATYVLKIDSPEYPGTQGVVYVAKDKEQFTHVAKTLWASKNLKTVETFYRTFAEVQPAYACNSYVCQGLTVPTVFVDFKDLALCTRNSLLLRQKLFYVMCSRAQLHLHNLM